MKIFINYFFLIFSILVKLKKSRKFFLLFINYFIIYKDLEFFGITDDPNYFIKSNVLIYSKFGGGLLWIRGSLLLESQAKIMINRQDECIINQELSINTDVLCKMPASNLTINKVFNVEILRNNLFILCSNRCHVKYTGRISEFKT